MLDGRTAETDADAGWVRGAVVIVVAGIILGAAYNHLGLKGRHAWGIAWIGKDKLASLETVSAANGEPAPTLYTDVNDPLAIPPSAGEKLLPEIPAAGRPVQIEVGALKQLVDARAATIVDARERAEFLESHIPGALNLPYDETVSDPALLESLDTGGRPIVTYCGGGSCELSLSLAHELVFAGHDRVAVYIGGLPEWIAEGHPTEKGSAVMSLLRAPLTVRICQIVIGVAFAWAGLAKLGDLNGFAEQIHNFRVLPVALENLAAMFLPWIEIVAALALILGVQSRGGAVVVLAMLAVFTLGVIQAFARGLDIECGCFGTDDASTVGLVKIGQNLVLLGVAAVACLRRRG